MTDIFDGQGSSESKLIANVTGAIRISFHSADAASSSEALVQGAVKVINSSGDAGGISQSISTGATLLKNSSGYSKSILSTVSSGAITIINGAGASNSFLVVEAYHTDRDIRNTMAGYLPSMLQESKVINSVQQSQAAELSRLDSLVNQMLQDYFWVVNASEKGIELWENDLLIKTDRSKPLVARRIAVIERLTGPTLMTKSVFENVVNQFYDSTVEQSSANFTVKTTIWSKRGIPGNIKEMEAAIEEILPIYLDHEFIPTWLTWGEIEDYGLTGDEAEQYTSGELMVTFLIPYSG